MHRRQSDVVGDLLLGQRQPVAGSGACHAERYQAVAQFEQESGQPFLSVGAAETNVPVVQMAFILRELPSEKYRDGKILGGQTAGFLVVNPPCRCRRQRLDRVGLS